MAKLPPPPAYKPPPKKKAKQPQTQQAAVNAILKQYPAFRNYMPAIRQAAVRWGMDPVYLLATLAFETDGTRASWGQRNSAGALGLAQVVDTTISPATNPDQYKTFLQQFNNGSAIITDREKLDPAWAINYMAWRMSHALNVSGGDLNAAYVAGYNPGFTGDSRGAGPLALTPGWYSGIATQPQTPAGKAGASVDTSLAKQALTDPWATIDKTGRLKYVYSPEQPKNVVMYGGRALHGTEYQQAIGQYNDQYLGWTGKLGTPAQLAQLLKKGTTIYQLQLNLAETPAARHSPIWKQRAPDYMAAWHNIYGPRAKPDQNLVAQAIVHNLSGDAFADRLRSLPGYVNSLEFKQHAVTMSQAYEAIYGPADQNANAAIRQATLNGWTPDQFQQYLRKLPEYSHTPEYRSKQLTFMSALGMISGDVATLQRGPGVPTNKPGVGQLTPAYGQGTPKGQRPPYDPRLPPAVPPTPAGANLKVA